MTPTASLPATAAAVLFASNVQWQQCLSDFFAALLARSGSEATLKAYRSTLSAFFAASPEKLPDAYSRQEVTAFVHGPSRARYGQKERTIAASTMNHRQAVLASFYRYAATYTVAGEGGYPVPLLQRAAPTLGMVQRKVSRRYRALSMEEMRKFFAVIPIDTVQGLRDRALFLTFFWTSRRRMEVLRLTWGDLEEAVIIDPDGTRRTGTIYHFRGKGHGRLDDSAELPAPAKKALDAYLQASNQTLSARPEDALFPALSRAPSGKEPDPRRPICPQTVQALLKRYCRLAGVKPFGMHAFRHTSARVRYSEGEDIRSIQKLLRHASLATTDAYLSVLTGTADPFARKLEGKYGAL